MVQVPPRRGAGPTRRRLCTRVACQYSLWDSCDSTQTEVSSEPWPKTLLFLSSLSSHLSASTLQPHILGRIWKIHQGSVAAVFSHSAVSHSCNPMDCSPPGSSVHGMFQARNTRMGCHFLLQGTCPTQGSNHVSCTGRRFLHHGDTREAKWVS